MLVETVDDPFTVAIFHPVERLSTKNCSESSTGTELPTRRYCQKWKSSCSRTSDSKSLAATDSSKILTDYCSKQAQLRTPEGYSLPP